ncbi:MAG: DmsC/YnfH family molybdoenzyme membrane anchor subunit [Rhodanobacteraceae bacterium]
MRPTFSVIVFTVLSGAGFGLLAWLGLALGMGVYVIGVNALLVALSCGLFLSGIGLLASTVHLGKPWRGWRGLSQWRSSWLSREAIAALASYIPLLILVALRHAPRDALAVRLTGLVLAACALTTVYCTARIYTSLKPIPAWRLPQVLPGYLLLALASGGLWLWLIVVLQLDARDVTASAAAHDGWLFGLLLVVLAAGLCKRSYWRAVDRDAHAPDAGRATGLDRFGRVVAASAPNTEANYLLREMGFVLARRHRYRLRAIALIFVVVLCALLIGLAMLIPPASIGLAPLAVFSVMSGLIVERWLFFAEARHHVVAWYPGTP